MRYIVIFLLLLNFAYYSWSRYRPSQSEAGPGSEDLPLLNTGLMLVREFDEQAATLSAADQDQSPMCALVANFPTADEAYSFMSESSTRGFSAVLNLTGEALAPQFRVYIRPSSSRSIATITLEGLSAAASNAGLEVETYLITRGNLANAIALGVFARPDSAELVRAQVAALGYSVQIQEIPVSTGDIQVLLRHPQFDSIGEAQWLDLSADRPYLTVTENLCETIAQGLQFP